MINPFGTRRILTLSATLLVMCTMPAFAHHSFAMFDNDHQVKMEGKVNAFQWTNPHVYIELDVADAKGVVKHWSIECASPGILNRVGWKFNMVRAGDTVQVIVAPMRTGQPAALLKAVKLGDGKIFNNGGPAGPATIQF